MSSRAETEGPRQSLSEVHGSVPIGGAGAWKRLFAFMGPAYMVSVGYMDPGNWATDLEGGARFGYALIWVLLMSNLMAVLLQTLSARLGVVTGHDLAQGCRAEYSRPVNFTLWLLAEVAIAATDLAEILGTVIALKLLFGLPMLWGCFLTALDTFLLLYLQRLGIRKMEAFILALVTTIGSCFLIQIFLAGPDLGSMAKGLIPSLPSDSKGPSLYIAIGILGATVMPHNLYLHSALVQSRRIGPSRREKAQACRYNLIDSAVALNVAFFVNAAILILAAATFNSRGERVASIEEAHELLPRFLGASAPILFGIALLCAGQSSTLTGTLAGQIVMEGYLQLRVSPWLRRLITRSLALIPAVVVIALAGEDSTQELLILSQVILSLQLAFAVIPLIHFTSSRRNMGEFASRLWVRVLAWLTAAIIVGLNGQLVFKEIGGWVEAARGSWSSAAVWGLAAGLYGLVASAIALLIWVTLKPILRPSPAWQLPRSMDLDWSDALRPRALRRIGVAVEHGPADAEILSRALGLAEAGKVELFLLHVADRPLSPMLGSDMADLHTKADEQYLDELATVLKGRGYTVDALLLRGPDRVGEIVGALKRSPVDLLVVGSHGHGLVRDLLYGQTVDRVRHGLEVPMLIARPRGHDPASVLEDVGDESA